MDENRARSLLQAERAEVQGLLAGSEQAGQEDRETEDEEGGVDSVDPATSLTAEGMDDAITDSLRARRSVRARRAPIDRALKRLDDGSYGRSVRSGVPIPDERLEADPAAELTVEEARQAGRGEARGGPRGGGAGAAGGR